MISCTGKELSTAYVLHEERDLPYDPIREAMWGGLETLGMEPSLARQAVNLERAQLIPDRTSNSDDPQEYFSIAGVLIGKGLFDKTDIQFIRELFQKHPITKAICFHDLLGLEIFQSLQEMKPYLKKGEHKELLKEFGYLYFEGYMHLMRNGDEMKDYGPPDGESVFFSKERYQELLDQFISRIEGELPISGKREVQKIREAQVLLNKFLSSEQAAELLSSTPLSKWPDTISTESFELEEIFDNFKNYLELIKICIPGKLFESLSKQLLFLRAGDEIVVYQDLLQQIQEKSVDLYKDQNQIQSELGSILVGTLTYFQWCKTHAIPKRDQKNLSPREIQEVFFRRSLESSMRLNWLEDVKTVLENLVFVESPSFDSYHAYCNRARVNLGLTLEWVSSYNARLEPDSPLMELASHCQELIINSPVLDLSKELFRKKEECIFSHMSLENDVRMRELHEQIYLSLAPTIEAAEQMLSEFSVEETRDPFLIDKMTFLSRILVLHHDLGVTIGKEENPTEETLLPAFFLEFLFPLEKKGSVELAPAPPEELYLPAPSSILPAASLSERAVADVSDASALFDSGKLRHVECVLKSLGLAPVKKRGKGSHAVWKAADGRSAVVPRGHGGEIPKGTLRSIENQMNQSKPAAVARRKKKR